MVLMPLLMLLPLLALPIFWLLPWGQALPVYLFLVAISAAMMWVMRKTMKMPPKTGAECLVGREAEVASRTEQPQGKQYMVRVDGELWTAQSSESLQAGDVVVIVEVRSNALLVKRKGDISEIPAKPDTHNSDAGSC